MRRGYVKVTLLLLLGATTLMAAAGVDGDTAQKGLVALIFGSFAAGLLLTFTPCVLPMVPILSSIIVGQGEQISRWRALWLSSVYVLGTAVTYAAMGALAGATGEQLQSYFENVWAIGAVSLIFVLMALSMFGLFTVALPASIQSRLNAASARIRGGSTVMVFLMGLISALVIGACVSPILIAFLGVAIAQGSALLGGVTMFFMALGMGVPLILIGIGLGALLPKAGAWMERIKQVFGVLLLATGIYFFNTLELLSPLLVWGTFLVILSIYLGATEPLPSESSGWLRFGKGVGVVMLIWGIMLLIGAAYGMRDLSQPLPKSMTPAVKSGAVASVRTHREIPFEEVATLAQLKARLRQAAEAGKMAILYFSNDFCGSCKKYKAITFRDPAVEAILKKEYVALHVNMTDKSDSGRQAIRKRYKVFGPPTFVFFDREGNEIADNRIYGFQRPDEFYDMLELMAQE